MQKTYMEKVRSIQNQSKLKPFGVMPTDKIIEKTVGEEGTMDSRSDDGKSQK